MESSELWGFRCGRNGGDVTGTFYFVGYLRGLLRAKQRWQLPNVGPPIVGPHAESIVFIRRQP
jgi:hypothetical protein